MWKKGFGNKFGKLIPDNLIIIIDGKKKNVFEKREFIRKKEIENFCHVFDVCAKDRDHKKKIGKKFSINFQLSIDRNER